MSDDRNALAEALDYFRPNALSRDQASIVLTVGKMRGHLAVIEAALRSDAGAETRVKLPEHALVTLRYMHERATRMMQTANRIGDQAMCALYREEVDALNRVLPLTPTEDGRDAF